ncbi:MAG: GTPase, partial [Bilifractor sp.]|nr:GTPase [Bilifractor sp.]
VGKSTFINKVAKRKTAKAEDRPGVTRSKQWVPVDSTLELLDTPGILWPRFDDPKAGVRLAFIGSVSDDVVQTEELSLELIRYLTAEYPGMLEARYGVSESEEPVKILENIAVNRKCLSAGNQVSYEKAAAILLDEFRRGALGRVTLEIPEA